MSDRQRGSQRRSSRGVKAPARASPGFVTTNGLRHPRADEVLDQIATTPPIFLGVKPVIRDTSAIPYSRRHSPRLP